MEAERSRWLANELGVSTRKMKEKRGKPWGATGVDQLRRLEQKEKGQKSTTLSFPLMAWSPFGLHKYPHVFPYYFLV